MKKTNQILSIEKSNLNYEDFVSETTKMMFEASRNNSAFILFVLHFSILDKDVDMQTISTLLTRSAISSFEDISYFSISGFNQYIVINNNDVDNFFKELNDFKDKIREHFTSEITIKFGYALYNNSISNFDKLFQTSIDNLRRMELTEDEISNKPSVYKLIEDYISMMEKYDTNLCVHSHFIAKIVRIIAQELKLPVKEIEKLVIASLIHDIGYLKVPKEVFNKKGVLTQEEIKIIKSHPQLAVEHFLKDIPDFEDISNIVLAHHEFLDGSGYPQGLKGDQIPLGSQIISIVDSYRTMQLTTRNSEKHVFDEIVDYFIKNSGRKWSENVVTIFLAVIATFEIEENY